MICSSGFNFFSSDSLANQTSIFLVSLSRDFIENKTETVTYPLSVVDQLTKLLQASSLVYPPAKRRFGTFETGFLERI